MTSINVNSKNAERALLKKQEKAEATTEVRELGREKRDSDVFEQIKTGLLNGDYKSTTIDEFKDILKNAGACEVTAFSDNEDDGYCKKGGHIQFIFDEVSYHWTIGYYFLSDFPERSTEPEKAPASKESKGVGVQNMAPARGSAGAMDLPFEEKYLELLDRANNLEARIYEILNSGTAAELREIETECAYALGIIDTYLSDDEITDFYKKAFNSLKENFTIKGTAVEARLLDLDYPNITFGDAGDLIDGLTVKMETILNVVKEGGNYDIAMSRLDSLWNKLNKYASDFPELEDKISELRDYYVKTKKYDIANIAEQAGDLKPGDISEHLGMYSNILDQLNKKVGESSTQQNIENILIYAETLASYKDLQNKLEANGQLGSSFVHQLAEIEQKEYSIQNKMKDEYKSLVNNYFSDSSLSAEEAKTAQDYYNAVKILFPNTDLENTISYITKGWKSGDIPEFDYYAKSYLSDDQKEKYDRLLALDTSTYPAKKEAIELIEELLPEFEEHLNGGAGGGGGDGFFKGYDISALVFFLNLRKDFLQQQVDYMEQYILVKRLDIKTAGMQQQSQMQR